MGFMTEVSILNDQWHEAKKDPQAFVDWIQRGMNWSDHYDGPYYPRKGVSVEPSHHADDVRLYHAGRNSFYALDRYSIEKELKRHPDDSGMFFLDYYESVLAEAEQTIKDARKFIKEERDK